MAWSRPLTFSQNEPNNLFVFNVNTVRLAKPSAAIYLLSVYLFLDMVN